MGTVLQRTLKGKKTYSILSSKANREFFILFPQRTNIASATFFSA